MTTNRQSKPVEQPEIVGTELADGYALMDRHVGERWMISSVSVKLDRVR